jgi:hypothetical protein
MNLSESAARRWILVAAFAGLALRLAFGVFYWVDKPLTHDEREYLALAEGLSTGRGFTYDPAQVSGTGQQFGRAPGYPAFLAMISAGTGEHTSAPTRVKMLQALIGALTAWLIGSIALGAAGPLAGVIGALIAAFYPPLVWIPSYVFSESLYSALALLTAHTLQRAATQAPGSSRGRRDGALALASGALAGIAMLVRPAMLFFVPIAVVWLVASRRLVLAVALIAASAAVVTPWTVRNARVHGRFVLVASEGGVTFWTGNHPLARGEGDLAANPSLKMAELEFRRKHHGLTPEALEPLYYRDALHWIAANPGSWLALLARKAFYTVVPVGPSYTLHSRRYWAASVISYAAVLPLSVLGFIRLRRSAHRPTAVLLLGVSAVLVGLAFFPQERFRIPVIDPVLIIAAAVGASSLLACNHDAHGAVA